MHGAKKTRQENTSKNPEGQERNSNAVLEWPKEVIAQEWFSYHVIQITLCSPNQ